MASTVESGSEQAESDSEQAEQLVTRTDIGASIEAKMKRGEGTRDEDRVTIKGKGETAEEALDEFYTLLEQFEEDISSRLRNINPDRSDE